MSNCKTKYNNIKKKENFEINGENKVFGLTLGTFLSFIVIVAVTLWWSNCRKTK